MGPWKVECDEGRIVRLAFDGREVFRAPTVTAFHPGWKDAYFSMESGSVSTARREDVLEIAWGKEVPGTFSAKTVLMLDTNSAQWNVALTAMEQGPVEVGFLISPESVRSAPGLIQCQAGKFRVVIDDYTVFDAVRVHDHATFETPEMDLRFEVKSTTGAWMLQDKRRTSLEAIRLIIGMSNDGDNPLQAELGVRLQIKTYPAEDIAGRRAWLAQRGLQIVPLAVKNASFEESDKPEGWSHPAKATIVEDQPGHGRRCVRLVIESQKDRGVYITQRVPIKPGAWYRASALIRTKDVKAVPVGGKESVGATLIVEWADREGKWLAPGAYSRTKGFGTSGWKTYACENLLAPPGAGFATIFLALRATGTAWFDDVQFFEVRRSVLLVGPRDGRKIKNNRPRFEWEEDFAAPEYQIEISQDERFPPGEGTVTAKTPDAFFVPAEPLTPRNWYWRVTVPGAHASPVWRFTQSAPIDADTAGPRITPVAQSITRSDEAMQVRISDPGGVRENDVCATALPDHPLRVKWKDNIAEIIPEGGWSRGAHRIAVAACDNLGNESREEFWIAVAPAPPRSLTWTWQRGVFDGEKHIFPMGIYQVKEKDFARVKSAGFTLIHQYTWESSQDDEKAREFLEAAHVAGLTAFVGFDRGTSSKNGLVQGNEEHVARRIAALRDHPALFAWYLFDEPDLDHQYVAPRNLRRWYRFIKALDPFHPIIVTLARKNSITEYGEGCYDVYWTMAYRDTKGVAELTEEHQRELGPGKPHLAIVHAYDRDQRRVIEAGQPVDDGAFQPDLALFRANAYMALAHGSSGLCWWWYGDGRKKFLSVGDVPAAWGWLSTVVGEVQQLMPVLTAEGAVLPLTVKCTPEDAGVRAWAKKTKHGITLIAVSPDAEGAVSATIGSDAFPDEAMATVRFENREVVLSGKRLTDRFGPTAAHVYEIGF